MLTLCQVDSSGTARRGAQLHLGRCRQNEPAEHSGSSNMLIHRLAQLVARVKAPPPPALGRLRRHQELAQSL